MKIQNLTIKAISILGFLLFAAQLAPTSTSAATLQTSGAVGVEGTIPSNPPTQAPTISTPINGQTFSTVPITVAGLCPSNLLIEVFKNGVFAGSVECQGGSYSLKIDLFSGTNILVARAYDSLNQAGPDSTKITVNFNDSLSGSTARVSLITAYSKRGAAPGETLTWPLSISGGSGPYAITVDWGDKSVPDLLSRSTAGNFTIEHVYSQAGVYNVTIKASDVNGSTAFLQVVGVGNGPIQQSSSSNKSPSITSNTSNKAILLIMGICFPLLLLSFWLGKRHQLQTIRTRLRRGQRPF